MENSLFGRAVGTPSSFVLQLFSFHVSLLSATFSSLSPGLTMSPSIFVRSGRYCASTLAISMNSFLRK